ncbi:MAG: thiopurine S-methyltransferase [Spirochaetia bacterium]|nr:thiopurine S-methyltransferase [Spirochaetia bacterium]
METAFWHERWKQHQTGFHQKEVNSHLKNYWGQTDLPKSSAILVPLCGKSLDLLWLADQQYRVVGIELSEIAASEFCAENNFQAVPQNIEGGHLLQPAPLISFLCKDFFKVTRSETGKISGVYDRAALVALPPEMRKKYAAHLTALLDAGAKIFLVAFEYDQSKMQGPPFSVPENEILELFGEQFVIHEINVSEFRAEPARLAALPEKEPIRERVYILEKK